LKAELTLPQELVDRIVDKVVDKLKIFVSGNGKKENDAIFDVQGLSSYLKVSKQWVYERTHLNEIPFYKIEGHVRFKKSDIDKWLQGYHMPAVSTPLRSSKAIKAVTSLRE
jgi:excisionase family DNA binding protein